MKASTVIATALFGAIAAAAPFDKRALVTKTEVVVETIVVYTTVYGDQAPIAPATTTASAGGLFFEKPASSEAAPTSTAIYTPPVVETPAPAPSSAPAPSVVFTPVPSSAPAPKPTSVYTPAPEPTSVYTPPAAVSSVVAEVAKPSSAPATSNPSGEKYHGDITIYDNTGGFGACGTALHDSDMIVALSVETYGASTYDVMTGAATNKWCGQDIVIKYNGNQITAKIMDMCPGCKGADIDLSLAAWKALTGLDEKTRLQADWWKA